MVKKRLFYVVCTALFLFVLGGAYGIILHYTNLGFVCPVRFVTGWKCPGCGVTHMCIALLHLNFAAAFMANPALFLLSPLLIIVFIRYFADYIQTGHWQVHLWQNIVLWFCITILILYSIVRNVFSFP